MTTLGLIGLALGLAGTGASVAASEEAKGAAEKKTREELTRQQNYQNQAAKVFGLSQEASAPSVAEGQIAAGQKTAQDEYAKLQATPLSMSTPESALGDAQISQNKSDAAFADRTSRASAVNQGFANLSLQQYLKNLAANQQINVQSSRAQNSQNVLPYELNTAAHSADGLMQLGAGLGATGSILGSLGGPGVVNPGNGASFGGFARGLGPVTRRFAASGAVSPGQQVTNALLSLYPTGSSPLATPTLRFTR